MYSVLEYELKKNPGYDILILLQPTSPLRTVKDIDKSLKLMIDYKRKACVSFIKLKYIPDLMFKIETNFKLKKFKKINLSLNRQQYEKYYYPSGDIYISFIKRLLLKKNFLDKNTFPYIIDNRKSIDIDDILDFKFGELKLKLFSKKLS